VVSAVSLATDAQRIVGLDPRAVLFCPQIFLERRLKRYLPKIAKRNSPPRTAKLSADGSGMGTIADWVNNGSARA
jgi:hypothetical protein